MTSTELYSALEFSGFIGEEFDGDIHQPKYNIHNDLGVYVGDVLEAKGFVKTEVKTKIASTVRTWTTFRLGELSISHRSLDELPTVSTFSFSNNQY